MVQQGLFGGGLEEPTGFEQRPGSVSDRANTDPDDDATDPAAINAYLDRVFAQVRAGAHE